VSIKEIPFIVKFVFIAIAFAIVTTWVFNNTKGSVLLAILVHTSIDAFTPMRSVVTASKSARM
jgi:membrane protease YdiL (CAAX protease family)